MTSMANEVGPSDEPEGDEMSNESNLHLPIAYTTVEACVAIAAVFGNLLVIVVFVQDRRLRKVTNFYIISLSVADLLVGAIGIPSAILTRVGIPRNSIRLCLVMLSLLMVLCTISILNLVAVSLDRYWAILHPLDYHKRISEKTAFAIICACWLLGTVIGFLPLFGWNNNHLARDACFFIPLMNYNYLMFLYFVTIVFPAIIMAFFYIRIYIVVVQQLSLNKVRQLNCGEFGLSKLSTTRQSNLDRTNHFLLQTKNNASPKGERNVRLKSFKSVSSSHETSPTCGHYLSMVAFDKTSTSEANDDSESTSPEVTRQSGQDGRWRPNKTCNSAATGQNRKWTSLLAMRSLADSFVVEPQISKKLSKSSSMLSTFSRSSNRARFSYSRREVKKAQKLFVIVVFFMLCWLPLYTSNTIQAFCHHCPTPSSNLLDFLIILSHINSAGSPFLYAFHMKDFREALRRLVCKGAINQRKLRDLRREELFSVSGRRAPPPTGIEPIERKPVRTSVPLPEAHYCLYAKCPSFATRPTVRSTRPPFTVTTHKCSTFHYNGQPA